MPYTSLSGPIYAGLTSPSEIDAEFTSGTVSILAEDVTSSGFTLLSTASTDTSEFRHNPHSGCCWDEGRQTVWFYGAETHSVESNYDNSMYAFDTRDGKFKRIYQQTSWPAGYRVGDDGYLWANAGKTIPWAAHTFNRLSYDTSSDRVGVFMDLDFHSYTASPVIDGGYTVATRRSPIWWFNTADNTWEPEWSADIDTFIRAETIHCLTHSDTYGYLSTGPHNIHRLDDTGSYTSNSVSGSVNTQYHDTQLFHNDTLYKILGNADTILLSKHPMSDLGASVIKNKSEFAALSGWSTTNRPATLMSDGNILFLAYQSSTLGAFIYNTTTDTVTNTGYTLSAPDVAYDFKLEWSAALNAGIYITSATAGTAVQTYLIKV